MGTQDAYEDTGPGLEAQVSWDYSHSPVLTDAFIALEGQKGVKSRAQVASGNQPPAVRDSTAHGLAEERKSSGIHASTSQQLQGTRARAINTGGQQCTSAFEPASRQVGWNTTADEQRQDVSSSPAAAVERAETVEEKDLRVKAERRAERTERAAQIASLAALSLLLIAATLFLVLAYTGWNVLAAAAALFCASVAGYPALQLLWFALSSQMFNCWKTLIPEDRFRWGQKGSSLVHSFIMALVGISIVLGRDWKSVDLISGRDDRVAAFIGLELGYLLQDTGMEVYKQVTFGRSFSLLHWLHHLIIMCGLPWYFKYFKGDYFFGTFFLWNTSTVPLQLRWFQRVSNMQRGPLFQLNNLALLLSFTTCRILIIPYLMQTYGSRKGWALYQVPFRIPRICTAACGLFVAINSIWLWQLLHHAFRKGQRTRTQRVSGQQRGELPEKKAA